ncbi:putative iron-dependent peroxidase [Motilibacter peucedani]|uniref:Putative iron-dependent peroxidase n=1 Tax=Motilibacter peucedani TaxID=598650 RepID=A0A420XQC4_9ACTN|nr:Dyp-type peroxidase [Motilibacter peucedani]RKS75422.1 putative iron-dependent peroxidase [Motilibacter peucedani]
MTTAQPGIFALGTTDHLYVELDLVEGAQPRQLAAALAALVGPETTIRGVSVVVGLRPELWAEVAPGAAPADAADFGEPVVGLRGYRMPATQHDAWLWIAGGARDVVFDAGTSSLRSLAPLARAATEVGGWLYRHDRDLTGFVDGTENPSQLEAYDAAVVQEGPGAGSSVVLVQQWRHSTEDFAALPTGAQERIIGRTLADSVELDEDDMPRDSHVKRTVLERDGVELPIFRRNVAYGGVTDHGTMFVGFSVEQYRLAEMLRRMAGADGVRDALTRYTTPLTGAYYVVPSVEALRGLLE